MSLPTTYLTPKLQEGETIDLSLYSPRERINIRLYGLAFKDYTPLMLMDYKQKWKDTSTQVDIRGGYGRAMHWCKTHLFHQDFFINKHGNPDDGHQVHFKNAPDAMIFKLSFNGIN